VVEHYRRIRWALTEECEGRAAPLYGRLLRPSFIQLSKNLLHLPQVAALVSG